MSKNEKVEEEIIEEADIPEIDKDVYIAKLNDDLSEQRKKTDEYFEHLKRNMAEFDNFKKRMSKEKENLYASVTSDIIEDLLPIIDNFEQAIGTECTDTNFKDGIVMIYNQIKDSLMKQGLETIQDLGETFDPNLHQAVMHEECDQYGEKEVIEVFRKGYRLGDKVIRHSMVKVAN
ncbi:MAG: nucleotide exchange factor GrpE [Clostridia bacterium]|nr:nucleotide exchange factor GrpE [Clostridia bacterium]MDD4386993.1 nucleotide exchange factor GrpE [Clostridia bacterium]